MTIRCLNCGTVFQENLRTSPDKYKCPLCGYRYIDMDIINGAMGIDRYVTQMDEYKDIAE